MPELAGLLGADMRLGERIAPAEGATAPRLTKPCCAVSRGAAGEYPEEMDSILSVPLPHLPPSPRPGPLPSPGLCFSPFLAPYPPPQLERLTPREAQVW